MTAARLGISGTVGLRDGPACIQREAVRWALRSRQRAIGWKQAPQKVFELISALLCTPRLYQPRLFATRD